MIPPKQLPHAMRSIEPPARTMLIGSHTGATNLIIIAGHDLHNNDPEPYATPTQHPSDPARIGPPHQPPHDSAHSHRTTPTT
ncbi:hypothetical protein PUR49_25420, partial [Streptomyces sp. BE147]|nr:hypothetical protein [Streptomyces sp. BE147]